MPVLPIRIYDDPVLRQKAKPIERPEARHRQLAADMAETMYEARGIGLAANQVGQPERMIVFDVDWANEDNEEPARSPVTLINPELIDESTEDDVFKEGCLSLPEIEGNVWRAVRIRYRYQDLEGRTIEAEAKGMKARCILHEIDHLNGVLFLDHLVPDERQKLAGRLARLRKRRGAGTAT